MTDKIPDKIPDKMDLKATIKYLNRENNKLLDIIIDLKRNFDRDNRCSICLGNVLCNVIIPCGHLCLCNSSVCLNTVKSISRCPICNSNYNYIQRIYRS